MRAVADLSVVLHYVFLKARPSSYMRAVPYDRAYHNSVFFYHRVVAYDRVRYPRAAAYRGVDSDDHRTLELRGRIYFGAGPRANALNFTLRARYIHLDPALQGVYVGEPVLAQVADVFPITVRYVAVERLPSLRRAGKRSLLKSNSLPSGR